MVWPTRRELRDRAESSQQDGCNDHGSGAYRFLSIGGEADADEQRGIQKRIDELDCEAQADASDGASHAESAAEAASTPQDRRSDAATDPLLAASEKPGDESQLRPAPKPRRRNTSAAKNSREKSR